MLGLKLNHVSKRGHWCLGSLSRYAIRNDDIDCAVYTARCILREMITITCVISERWKFISFIHSDSLKSMDEDTYQFQNYNGCTVEVWVWMSNFTCYILTNIFHPASKLLSRSVVGTFHIKGRQINKAHRVMHIQHSLQTTIHVPTVRSWKETCILHVWSRCQKFGSNKLVGALDPRSISRQLNQTWT